MSPPEASETRERLLSEAERMFASRGYDGASVRLVTEAAGANVAAVSYYFGGKEGLYRTVFERMLVELRERRIRRIRTDLEGANDGVTLEGFLTSFAAAFFEPLVEGERAKDFISLFDLEMRIHKVPTTVFFAQLLEPMLALFSESLERIGLDLDRPTSAQCLMSLVAQLAHALKMSRRLADDDPESGVPSALDDVVPHIVRFSAAGIRACALGPSSRA